MVGHFEQRHDAEIAATWRAEFEQVKAERDGFVVTFREWYPVLVAEPTAT
jgi:hypothetical protein